MNIRIFYLACLCLFAVSVAKPFAPNFECVVTENALELGYEIQGISAKIEDKDGVKYCWYISERYGKQLRATYENEVLTTFYANGSMRAKELYKDGALNGVYKLFYPNENLESKMFYKNGVAEGLVTEYYKSGVLRKEVKYKEGSPVGVSKGYYESGKLLFEVPYVNGEVEGVVKFYCEDGQIAGSGKYVGGELESYMVSSDGVRGSENFDVVEHFCKRARYKDGVGDGLAGLLGGGGGGVSTKAKGSIKTPSERDIDMGAGGGIRSKSEIQKVVQQRTPGLRHTYNRFLKKKPGFSGKVTLKFTIAPGGEITSISIASSTTGFSEFDNEIKSAVSRWKFGTVKSGNTTVSIPFTFSE